MKPCKAKDVLLGEYKSPRSSGISTMKHTVRIIVISLITSFTLSACGASVSKSAHSYTPEYLLGVIESTEQINRSFLNLYSDSLESVGEVRFDLGSMGSFFHPPQVVKDKMYVVPQGIGNQKEFFVMLELDLATGTSKEIELGLRGVNSFCVTEDYIFASSTMNAETLISRIVFATGEIDKLVVGGNAFIEQMIDVNGQLYVFGIKKNMEETSSFLAQYDSKALESISYQDITEVGISHLSAIYADGDIYFTAATKTSTQKDELPDDRLIKYNLQTKQFSELILDAAEPATIVQSEHKLYILHSNLVTGNSHGISIFDIETEKAVYTQLEEAHISQIEVYDNQLYALSDSSLYSYIMNGDTLTLEAEKDIRKRDGANPYYYVSSMFLKKRK